jgi:hypothetical protein
MLSPDGTELDVLFGNYPWLEEAINHTANDPAGYPIVKLPYLILLKMEAQRAQDWADVSRMLGWASNTDLDKVRAVVKRYTPEDSEDLESLIFIGKKEREFPPSDEAGKGIKSGKETSEFLKNSEVLIMHSLCNREQVQFDHDRLVARARDFGTQTRRPREDRKIFGKYYRCKAEITTIDAL